MKLLFLQFIENFVFIFCILLVTAYLILLERKVMAGIQRRHGPTMVGIWGLLQPIADGVKLFLKEVNIPSGSYYYIFLLAPISTLALSLSYWAFIPFSEYYIVSNVNLNILFIFVISSLNVYSILFSGWSSNSKYALLGSLRAGAQMVSYELIIVNSLFPIFIIFQTANFFDIVRIQFETIPFIFLFFPSFILFFISALAETNRTPFDLPEAEAELVAGYNVEYSSMFFAFYQLAEYNSVLVFSAVIQLCFLSGWNFFGLDSSWNNVFLKIVFQSFISWIKILFVALLFIVIRATSPRYKFTDLLSMCWKTFLPFLLLYIVIIFLFKLWFLITIDQTDLSRIHDTILIAEGTKNIFYMPQSPDSHYYHSSDYDNLFPIVFLVSNSFKKKTVNRLCVQKKAVGLGSALCDTNFASTFSLIVKSVFISKFLIKLTLNYLIISFFHKLYYKKYIFWIFFLCFSANWINSPLCKPGSIDKFFLRNSVSEKKKLLQVNISNSAFNSSFTIKPGCNNRLIHFKKDNLILKIEAIEHDINIFLNIINFSNLYFLDRLCTWPEKKQEVKNKFVSFDLSQNNKKGIVILYWLVKKTLFFIKSETISLKNYSGNDRVLRIKEIGKAIHKLKFLLCRLLKIINEICWRILELEFGGTKIQNDYSIEFRAWVLFRNIFSALEIFFLSISVSKDNEKLILEIGRYPILLINYYNKLDWVRFIDYYNHVLIESATKLFGKINFEWYDTNYTLLSTWNHSHLQNLISEFKLIVPELCESIVIFSKYTLAVERYYKMLEEVLVFSEKSEAVIFTSQENVFIDINKINDYSFEIFKVLVGFNHNFDYSYKVNLTMEVIDRYRYSLIRNRSELTELLITFIEFKSLLLSQ